MADQKIKYSDLFDEDIFAIAREGAKQLITTIEELKNVLRQMGDEAKNSLNTLTASDIDQLRALASEVKELGKLKQELYKEEVKARKISKDLGDIEKKINEEVAKQKQKLVTISQDEYKEIIRIKQAISEQQKTLKKLVQSEKLQQKLSKQNIKYTKSQVGAYDRLQKRLTELRKAYKDMSASGRASEKDLSNLRNEIQKLDKRLKEIDGDVGQFQRNVGDYSGQLKGHFMDLKDELGNFAGGFGKVINIMGEGFRAIVGGFKSGSSAVAGFGNAMKILGTSSILIVVTILVELYQALKSNATIMKIITTVTETLSYIFNELIGFISDYIEMITLWFDTETSLSEKMEKAGQLAERQAKRALNVGKALVGQNEELNDTIRTQIKLQDTLYMHTLKLISLRTQLAKLELDYEKIIEDSNNNVFARISKQLNLLEKQKRFVISFFDEQIARQREVVKLAGRKLKNNQNDLELQKKYAEEIGKLNDLEIEKNEKLTSIESERKSLLKERLDLIKEAKDLERDLANEILSLQSELTNDAKKQLAIKKKLAIEDLEYNKDLAKKKFEGNKIIQEKILKLYDEVIELTKEKFNKAKQEIIKSAKGNISDTLLSVFGSDTEKALAEIDRAFEGYKDKLIKSMQDLGRSLDEINKWVDLIEQKRLEKRTEFYIKNEKSKFEKSREFLQDNLDYEKEVNEIVIKDDETRRLRNLLAEKEYYKKLRELIQEHLEYLKEQGQESTDEYKQLNRELEIIGLKLQDITTELEKQISIDTSVKLKDRYNELITNLINGYDLLKTYLDKVSDAVLKNVDTRISQINNRMGVLSKMANTNLQNINESMADLERQKEELELIKKEEESKKQRRELLLTALQTYQGYIQQGQKGGQALLSTIKDLTLLKSFISSLPVYHTGTEYVQAKGREVLAKLEVGERVIPRDLNRKLGGITNRELVERITREQVTFEYDNLRNVINEAVTSNTFKRHRRI